jgi:putative sporulation protein YyaC
VVIADRILREGGGRSLAVGAEGRRVHYEQPDAPQVLAAALRASLDGSGVPDRPLVFLCIGTDRSTGDALGPLVGERLKDLVGGAAAVLGTLDVPVHASNLQEVLDRLYADQPRAVVVAVDACLGRTESVGTIAVGPGGLAPGAGVNKALPTVGAAFVTGIVNVGGFMEYFVLQNTRLQLVVRMAEVISEALALTAAALAGREAHIGASA